MTAGPGTLAESTIDAPTRIGIVGEYYEDTTGDLMLPGALMIVQGANRIAVSAAVLGVLGPEFTSEAGPAESWSANLLRYTTSDSVERTSAGFGVALGGSSQLVGGAFTCRLPSGGTWQVRVRVEIPFGGGPVDPVISAPVVVSGGTGDCFTIIIPPIAVRSITLDAFNFTAYLLVQRLGGSGSTSIDFDEIVLMALDTPASAIIISDKGAGLVAMKMYLGQGERPELVTGDVPVNLRNYGPNTIQVWQDTGPNDQVSFWPYRGDAMISSALQTMAAVALTARETQLRTVTTGAVGWFRLEVTRYTASLVPQ
jgi:hypothetical protein